MALTAGFTLHSITVTALSTPWSWDHFWHLRTGLDALNSGLNPYYDHYSFTHDGDPIPKQAVAFQFLYAFLVNLSGYQIGSAIVVLLAAALFAVGCFTLLRVCNSGPFTSALTLAASAYFLQIRLIPRPEIFDLALVPIAFTLYQVAMPTLRLRHSFWIMLLVIFWVNYHAGMLAYVIFSGLYIEALQHAFIDKDRVTNSLKIAGSGLVVLALGFLNPDFTHPLITAATWSEIWRGINEHRSSIAEIEPVGFMASYFIISIVVLLWSLAIKRWGLSCAIAVAIYAAADRVRMVPVSGVIISCAIPLLAAQSRTSNVDREIRPIIKKGILISAAILIAVLLSTSNHVVSSQHKIQTMIPKDVVDYMEAIGANGNAFNRYHQGGYLIYRLAPSVKVFIDGRTLILYPDVFYADYLDVATGSAGLIEEALSQYAIDYWLWPAEKMMHLGLITQGEFKAEYIGQNNILYSKSGRLQNIATVANFPVCIQHLNEEAVTNAISLMEKQPIKNEPLVKALSMIAGKSQAPRSPAEFITEVYQDWEVGTTYDIPMRILGYHSALNTSFSDAARYFEKIQERTPLDVLHQIFFYIRANELDSARSILVAVIAGVWEENFQKLKPKQIFLLIDLYKELAIQGGSNSGTDRLAAKYFGKTVAELLSTSVALTDENVLLTTHCADILRGPDQGL